MLLLLFPLPCLEVAVRGRQGGRGGTFVVKSRAILSAPLCVLLLSGGYLPSLSLDGLESWKVSSSFPFARIYLNKHE